MVNVLFFLLKKTPLQFFLGFLSINYPHVIFQDYKKGSMKYDHQMRVFSLKCLSKIESTFKIH